MEAFFLNTKSSKFNFTFDNNMISYGFMLGDRNSITSEIGYLINIRQDCDNLSKQQKAADLENHLDNLDGDMQEKVKSIYAVYKKAKKTPKGMYRPKEVLAEIKAIESVLAQVYEEYYNRNIDYYKIYEFEKFASIFYTDGFGYFYISIQNPEKLLDKYGVRMSEVLSLEKSNDNLFDSKVLFFITPHFFHPHFAKRNCLVDANDESKVMIRSNAYLFDAITIPNLAGISMLELKALKNVFKTMGKEFRKAADEWITACYMTDDSANNFHLLKNKVLPALKSLQTTINEHPIFKPFLNRSEQEKDALVLKIGEVPLHTLWDYYQAFDATKPETHEALIKLKDKYVNKRFPVAIFNFEHQFYFNLFFKLNDDTEPKVPSLGKKKSIEID